MVAADYQRLPLITRSGLEVPPTVGLAASRDGAPGPQ